ncbi:hypothetical protein CRE_08758 [Caenorhabditis remanei]|uniref:NR LBD domain-containing protein n=1 Tax=Caenorhabditis remanei TaxID=31234 RepID=E3LHD0_CAERE|nr:hypothetical protein CRE_08758 [Caenorhabditis remanei]
MSPSLANFLGRPEFILCCEPVKGAHVKSIIDVKYLIEKGMKILAEESSSIPYKFENSLERLTLAMETKTLKKVDQKLQVVTTVGKREALLFWEQTFIAAARWFSGFSEFMELEMDIKIEILKSSWQLFNRLQKLAESAELHRKRVLGENEFVCAEGTSMSFDKIKIDWSWCTNYSFEQMRVFFTPNVATHWKSPVDTLIELEPSNVELTCSPLCLSNYVYIKLGKSTKEKFSKLLTD